MPPPVVQANPPPAPVLPWQQQATTAPRPTLAAPGTTKPTPAAPVSLEQLCARVNLPMSAARLRQFQRAGRPLHEANAADFKHAYTYEKFALLALESHDARLTHYLIANLNQLEGFRRLAFKSMAYLSAHGRDNFLRHIPADTWTPADLHEARDLRGIANFAEANLLQWVVEHVPFPIEKSLGNEEDRYIVLYDAAADYERALLPVFFGGAFDAAILGNYASLMCQANAYGHPDNPALLHARWRQLSQDDLETNDLDTLLRVWSVTCTAPDAPMAPAARYVLQDLRPSEIGRLDADGLRHLNMLRDNIGE